MAAIIAVKSGNWNDPTVWHLNRIPEVDDVVYAGGYTVTIDISTTVRRISNKASTGFSAVPIMTGYTTPSGIASSLTRYDDNNYQPWKAFDNTTSTEWIGVSGRPLPEWLQYEFVSPKIIIGYSVQNITYNGDRPTNWQFQAWDGTNWVVLDTVTGAPSQTTPYVRTFTNSTAYSRYRIYITASLSTNYVAISELRLFETITDAQNAASGGGFILNPNVSLNCTEWIEASNVTILTWAGGAGTTSSVTSPILYAATAGNTFVINGQGTLNVNIASTTTQGGSTNIYFISNTGTVNLVTNITPLTTANTGGRMVYISANALVNITGDLTGVFRNIGIMQIVSNCTVNIVGTVTYTDVSYPFDISTSICTMNITGTVRSAVNATVNLGIVVYNSIVLTIVGPIISQGNTVPLYLPSYNSIALFSGPFVYSPYGYSPVWASRYHLIPSTTTYIEFADSTTGGLPFPGAIAPRAQFISPSASSDSPDPDDVRFGVSYAYNSLTGTLRMPHPNQVTYGVAVDNTFGNAVLTAASVWDYLVANITVENSIGMRLKNVSTPQTTGEQLEAFLRLE